MQGRQWAAGKPASRMSGKAVREQNGQIRFANDMLDLAFDAHTGRWVRLTDLLSGEELLSHGQMQAPVTLHVNGVTTTTFGRAHWWSVVDAETIGLKATCTGYDVDEMPQGTTLTVHTREGDWRIDQRYTLLRDRAEVLRGLHLAYEGEGTALLRGVELRLPPAALGPIAECFVEVPGYATRAHQPLAHVSAGEYWDRIHDRSDIGGAPGWKAGLVCIDNPDRTLALLVWPYSEVDPSILRLRRGDQGTLIGHTVMLSDRFTSGHTIEWDGQHVRVVHAGWEEALQGVQDWYDEVGLCAADAPEWARSARIYELFVGESAPRPTKFPTLGALIDDLQRIHDLGFNVVEIMPHMPFPSYSVVDYYDVDLHYGSAQDLKRLTAQAHAMGMRVLLDVVLHGVMDREAVQALEAREGRSWLNSERLPARHPYRVEHPEWFMMTEFGTPAATYTWSFDHANEGYQDFMVDVFRHYMLEYDVDGFRVDALTWNYFPNWAEGLPYRASASIYASAAMMDRVRAGIRAVKPDAILYTETTGPLYTRSCDLGYNYDMQWLFSALVPPTSRRGFPYVFAFAAERIEAADLGTWLEQRRLTRPRGATTVHHLDSHDTHEWGGLRQYRREAFGEAASRALFALCCALDGGIMVYQGAEDSAEDYYRQMLCLKRDIPALAIGYCDYTAIQVDDTHVFAPLRTWQRQVVVPVIHLGDGHTNVTFRLPTDCLPDDAERFRITDLLTNLPLPSPDGLVWTRDQLGGLAVALGPYQVRVFEIVPV